MTTPDAPAVWDLPDGAQFPYAKDFNDVWHRRPDDDHWTRDADTQCHTVCGQAIPSVHVSQYPPGESIYPHESLCTAGCFADGDAP